MGSAALLGELVQTQGDLAVLQGRMEQLQKVVQLHDEKSKTPSATALGQAAVATSGKKRTTSEGNLEGLLSDQRRQLEAYENEIRGLRQKVEIQNDFLAKFQKALNQRQEELKTARDIEAKQASQIALIKKQAGSRIRTLNAELSSAREQLRELNAEAKESESSAK